jgi:flavin reductase (DIM6/NTAB) family NADH-FMN oxidoreductase RutF/DNA-binding MarR family transcriptional regulator
MNCSAMRSIAQLVRRDSPLNREEVMNFSASAVVLSEGNPAVDRRAFRQCLGQFATGVTIMTAEAAGQLGGVTANSFSSVSLEPPLVLWSISRASRSFHIFAEANRFAVNILGQDQIRLSQIFSSSEADKFAAVQWSIGKHGTPVLDGVNALLECERVAMHKGGDHVIIVARVLRFATFQGEPLIFAQGRYGIAESHPSLRSISEAAGEGSRDIANESSLMNLLFRTYHYVSSNFEDHRRAEGLTQAQVRVLAALYDSPGQTTENLARTIYLGKRDTEDALAELAERSFVIGSPDRTIRLSPAGRKCREAVLARAADFEEEQLAGLTEEEIVKAKRFLSLLISRNRPEWEGPIADRHQQGIIRS